jgi:hypothetical protein
MKKVFLTLFSGILFSLVSFAHSVDYSRLILRKWNLEKEQKTIEGSFYYAKNGEVYIEDAHNRVIHFPKQSLSKSDQEFVDQKLAEVAEINHRIAVAGKEQAEVPNLIISKSIVI